VWYSDSIEVKLEAFKKHENVILVYCDVETFGELATVIRKEIYKVNSRVRFRYRPFHALKFLLEDNIIPSFSTTMIRNRFQDINFSERHSAWLDWWIWTQISLEGDFYFIPEKKTRWRVYAKSNNSKFMGNLNNKLIYKESFYKDLEDMVYKKLKIEDIEDNAAEIYKLYRDKSKKFRNMHHEQLVLSHRIDITNKIINLMNLENQIHKENQPREGETIIKIRHLNFLKLTSIFAPYFLMTFIIRRIYKFFNNLF